MLFRTHKILLLHLFWFFTNKKSKWYFACDIYKKFKFLQISRIQLSQLHCVFGYLLLKRTSVILRNRCSVSGTVYYPVNGYCGKQRRMYAFKLFTFTLGYLLTLRILIKIYFIVSQEFVILILHSCYTQLLSTYVAITAGEIFQFMLLIISS